MSRNLDIKLFGPWGKVKSMFNLLPNDLKTISTSTQRSIAESFIRKVKSHLINQDIPGWTPLSPKYADSKMAKYGHEDILIASWDYYDSIRAWRKNGIYYAGVPEGLHYKKGIEIARVAKIHEDWSLSPDKPHRPLWSYTLSKDMGGVRGIKKTANAIIKEKLLKKGYPVKSLSF